MLVAVVLMPETRLTEFLMLLTSEPMDVSADVMLLTLDFTLLRSDEMPVRLA